MHLAVSAAGSLVCSVQLCPLFLHGIGAVLLLCFRCGCLLKRRLAFCCRHLGCCHLFLQYWQVEPADKRYTILLNEHVQINVRKSI